MECILISDLGDTCRNDYFEPSCFIYNTNGTINTMSRNDFRDGCAWNYNTVDVTYGVGSVVKADCLNHFDCSVLVSDNLHDCYTDEYQTVNETYTSYERGAWGWLSYPVTKWRYYTTRVITICGVLRWTYTCNSKYHFIYFSQYWYSHQGFVVVMIVW